MKKIVSLLLSIGLLSLSLPTATVSADDTIMNGRVIYTTFEDSLFKIKSARIDGSAQQDIITSLTDGFSYVKVSPDGQKIAYSKHLNNNITYTDIYVSSFDGQNIAQLTHSGSSHALNDSVSWSPDSTKLIYSSTESNIGLYPSTGLIANNWREIRMMSVDGSSNTLLSSNTYYEGNPVMTSSKVFWQSQGQYLPGEYKYNIYSANLDGSASVPLFSSEFNVGPKVSKDQQSLYFTSNETGQFELWTSDLIGGSKAQLTNYNNPNNFEYIVSQDGLSLYSYMTAYGSNLHKISLSDGSKQLVSNSSTDHPSKWQDFQPLIVRPRLKPNASIVAMPSYNISENISDIYDGLDLASVIIISGDASVQDGIITANQSGNIKFKVCSLSNPNFCSIFEIDATVGVQTIEAPNTGYENKID